MEGGGERKRKGGRIVLDWERLLPSGQSDDEPASVVVIEEPSEKSKPREVVMMEDGEDELFGDQYLKNISDKELFEKINRAKKMLKSSFRLNDGGEKLRASLRKQEAELERRNLPKDDDKCKKPTPLTDESTCTGAIDGLSPRGALPSVLASQSTFALHFCGKLDDKRATDPFGEELSIITASELQNMREKEQFPTQRTQKIGASSRQAPFKSPSHLSVNIDHAPISKGEQLGTPSSTPSPHQSDKDESGCYAKRENTSCFQPTINSRRNNKTVVLVDEEELEVDVKNKVEQLGESSKETRIYFPSRDDPKATEIRYSDMECLAPESYLSSTIMNFYIWYLQNPTSPVARKRNDCYFFNTYFYEKLKNLTKIAKETSFEKFRRWWKGVNLFEKAYIFLPIHENLHWSLIIICMPNKEDESGPIMLHLDSLGLHGSKSIFNDVKSFLIEEWKFLRQEEVVAELPIADNIWDKLSRRIDEKVIEVPQQRNEYDCGLFVLFFMERFIEEAPERLRRKDLAPDRVKDLGMFGKQWFRPEEASNLRRKISNLLKEEFKMADECTYLVAVHLS